MFAFSFRVHCAMYLRFAIILCDATQPRTGQLNLLDIISHNNFHLCVVIKIVKQQQKYEKLTLTELLMHEISRLFWQHNKLYRRFTHSA